jgi:hypothetical protein
MPSGHFAGGMAEGIESGNKQALAEQVAGQNANIQNRTIALQESNARADNARSSRLELDKHIQKNIDAINQIAEAGRAAGHTPQQIAAAAGPLLKDVEDLLHLSGRDPSGIKAQAEAFVSMPAAPVTDLGKLQTDLRNGYITQDEYNAKSAALTKNPGTTINVNGAGEKAFASELGKKSAEDFLERQSAARDAVASIESTDQALKLLNSGAFTGIGADYLVQAGKALQRIGITFADDAIKNTEAFAATRAQEVGRIIKLFGAGTGLSDADRDFATRAAAGDVTLNEQSIRKILDINSRAARNVIARYNADAAQVDPNIVPFDLRLGEPPGAPAEVKRKTIGGKNYINQNGAWFEE